MYAFITNQHSDVSGNADVFLLIFGAVVLSWSLFSLWWGNLSVGTKSLLFGVHMFWWHPVTVWWAWRKLYGEWPTWRECVCILVHDWGYFGCRNMDGPEGQNHTELGARLAGWFFGPRYYDLVRWHSRHLSKLHGVRESKLCWPDKTSMLHDPFWFYIIRARLSGEIHEYRQNADTRNGPDWCPLGATDKDWHTGLKTRLAAMAEKYVLELGRRPASLESSIQFQATPAVHPAISRSESRRKRSGQAGWR